MAKKAKPPKDSVPTAGKVFDPSQLKKIPPAPAVPAPEVEKVPGTDLISKLKGMGNGWDDEAEKLMEVPGELFRMTLDDATYYSSDENFGIASIISDLESGKLSKVPDYGVALYSSGGSVFFVLADKRRRIIVRERVVCVHDDPPQKDWSRIIDDIRSAISSSENAEKGLFAVFNSGLSMMEIG